MVGPKILGYCQKNQPHLVIKHDFDFYTDQQIQKIVYNPDEANPYESMLFNEFEKTLRFIDTFSKKDGPKKFTLHLPAL